MVSPGRNLRNVLAGVDKAIGVGERGQQSCALRGNFVASSTVSALRRRRGRIRRRCDFLLVEKAARTGMGQLLRPRRTAPEQVGRTTCTKVTKLATGLRAAR